MFGNFFRLPHKYLMIMYLVIKRCTCFVAIKQEGNSMH